MVRAWTRALVGGGQMLTAGQTGFADGLDERKGIKGDSPSPTARFLA